MVLRLKFLSILLFLSFNIYAQDVVTIRHTYYTSHFSKSKHIPVLVEYTLTAEMLSCGQHLTRKGERFLQDPELPEETNLQNDYKRSGYDRGHNMSAQDNECNSTGMNECFYFSNMFPQIHALNAGIWEKLEKIERSEAESYGQIRVYVGSLGLLTTIGEDNVVVPRYCWKIIYITALKQYQCYIFPNEIEEDKEIEHYSISLEMIEKKAGISFRKGNVYFN